MSTIVIAVRPRGKARARVTTRGTYTPDSTVQAEKMIGEHWKAMRGGSWPSGVPLVMVVLATFKRTKRNPPAGSYHTQRPDADNIWKLAADALNHVAYEDDSQIAVGRCVKMWGDADSLSITVEALEPPESRP